MKAKKNRKSFLAQVVKYFWTSTQNFYLSKKIRTEHGPQNKKCKLRISSTEQKSYIRRVNPDVPKFTTKIFRIIRHW
jgi:hypothetical protein